MFSPPPENKPKVIVFYHSDKKESVHRPEAESIAPGDLTGRKDFVGTSPPADAATSTLPTFPRMFSSGHGRAFGEKHYVCITDIRMYRHKDPNTLPMKSRFLASSLLGATLLLANVFTSCTGPSSLEKDLDSLMSETFPQDGPGAQFTILKDGKILLSKGYGLSDLGTGTPITDSTYFNICSVSKQFSSVALMLLSERGLLSLDDPINKYFPAFEAEFYSHITLRHLLSHTSGIPDARPRNEEQWQKYLTLNESKFDSYIDFDRFCEEEESVRYLEHLEALNFEPGTRYEYMNPTYQLILMIVEQVTGEDFDTWMRENVFLPAGMENTFYFEPDKDLPANTAHGYMKDDSGNWVECDYGEANFFGTKADGGIYTTPLEFIRWDRALYGDKVMSGASRKEVHTPRIATDIPDTDYGYGWFIEHKGGRPLKIYHTGDNGGFLIFEGRFPDKDIFYLIFANEPEWDREGTVEKVDQILQRHALI